MEAVDEMAAPSVGLNINKDLSPIAKGKRTKRHRPHSPTPFTIKNSHHTFPAAVSSSEDSTTTEEEDTARCLILLSRGHFSNHPSTPNHVHSQFQISKHKKNMETTTKTTSPGTCMYTCKTCDRSFSSFQALGGHRASHKKPKNEKKFANNDDFPSPSSNSLSLQLSNISTSTTTFSGILKSSPSPRIHVCSYCGAEFTSGQALGGHMRRHRGGPISPLLNAPLATATIVSDRTVLSLDINLPAPEDFGFAGSSVREVQNESTVHLGLFTTTTASTLVDCHY